MENSKTRLIEFLAYLKMGQNAFEKKVGIANGYIANLKGSIGSKIINRISESYPELSTEWLISGNGNMLVTSKLTQNKENDKDCVEEVFDENYQMVPVYNFDAVGGMHRANEITDTPAYIEKYVPFIDARNDDICMFVTGNSMNNAGSLLLLRKVEGWMEYFGYGDCFVLFLKDGRRVYKQIEKSEINKKTHILCVSRNSDYQSEELSKDFIYSVYKVIRTLTNDGF